MRTLNKIYLSTLFLLFTVSALFSQTDTNQTYYPNYISIEYSVKSVFYTLENIRQITFTTDNIISAAYGISKVKQININRINEISFKSGSYGTVGVWSGMILGGITCGVLAGSVEAEGAGKVFSVIGGAVLGIFIGGSIGNAIGGSIRANESYEIHGSTSAKTKELKRLLELKYLKYSAYRH